MSEETTEVGKVFALLPARFRTGRVAEKRVYYFSIDEEKWTVTLGPDACEVTEGKLGEDADCYLKTSTEIFLGTFRGEYAPSIMDFVSGKIKSNRPELLRDFIEAFDRS
ncbi:MAG TPA: hypothetical protein VJH03_16005 [Blastocatellia bacterium]|nr:hypothetical protein [Blastocatellia bacterium]